VDKMSVGEIRERIESVKAQINESAQGAGRAPEEVRLVVVTKTQPVEKIRAAIEAGATLLGENYAEEAVEKIAALGPQPNVEWHMIGHVQSRKAELVARHFGLVHSVDGLKLAGRLNRFAEAAGRRLPILLECNVSGEASKFGYPAWNESQHAAFLAEVSQILQFPNLEVRGLMTMPPYADDSEAARPFFARLRHLRDILADKFPQVNWAELSMGTSADFTTAIEEGATLVRVGTAIMGARQP